MIVLKFGGTSVGSPENIRRVCAILQRQLDRQPLVIVSAHGGVTDMLVELGRRAPQGDTDMSDFEARHREMIEALGLEESLLEPLISELRDLCRGMRLVGEASPRALDHLYSFGERCSVRIIAAFFRAEGVPAKAVDAYDLGLRTDSSFNRARPLPDDGRIVEQVSGFRGVPIVTGFIAKDEQGNITTLGRNGSDLSAALFGKALGAEEIQIWKDVDGVMTADPKIVPTARPIRVMGFDEASELAHYGGKVLHPASILPAMEGAIPVRVLDTTHPESEGTVILPTYEEDGAAVRAVVHKRGVRLVTLVSPRMLAQHGFLARVFGIAARHEVDVDLVATSEVSITMSVPSGPSLAPFAEELGEIGTVEVQEDQAMICVVGHGISKQPGVAAAALTTLAEAGIRVRSISQGAIKVNIALIIAEDDVTRAVAALHDRFFSG